MPSEVSLLSSSLSFLDSTESAILSSLADVLLLSLTLSVFTFALFDLLSLLLLSSLSSLQDTIPNAIVTDKITAAVFLIFIIILL